MSNYDELRQIAQAASRPLTCGGHQSTGSLLRCVECNEHRRATWDLTVALTPNVVLALLDEIDTVKRRNRDASDLATIWLAVESAGREPEAAAAAMTANRCGQQMTQTLRGEGFFATNTNQPEPAGGPAGDDERRSA